MPTFHQIPVKANVRATRNALLLVLAVVLTGCASSPDVADRRQSPVPVYGTPVAGDNERVSRLQDVFDRYEGTPYRYGGTTARGSTVPALSDRPTRKRLAWNCPEPPRPCSATARPYHRGSFSRGCGVFGFGAGATRGDLHGR